MVAGRRKRTPLEIALDRQLIVRLKLVNHLPNVLIAERVNKQYKKRAPDSKGREAPQISVELVKKELQAAKEEANEAATDIITDLRKAAIREYREFIAYLMERYEATCSKRTVKTLEEREGSNDKGVSSGVVKKTVTEKRDGDARYLEIVERCKWRIAELESVIPPRKIAPTNPDGTESFKFEGSEELKRLDALRDELLLIKAIPSAPGVVPGMK